MSSPPRSRFVLPLLLLTTALAPAALAQVGNLDRGRLIDTLQREGMSDLLLHFIEVEPSTDPVDNLLIQVAQLSLRLRDPQAKFTAEDHEAAFTDLRAAYLNLIESHRDHPLRPLWQTDFAEMLLFDYLQGLRGNAAEFYDLGTPATQQREAFESAAPLAFEHLVDATQGILDVESALPRTNPELHRRYDNDGTWRLLREDYGQLRTPLFRAQTAYYTTLLPDTHDYFKTLGNNKKVPRQARTPAEERARLLKLAAESLEPLLADATDRRGIRPMLLTFQARILAAQKQAKPALDAVEAVIALKKGDLWDLVANLTKGRVLALMNQPLAAQDQAQQTTKHALAQRSPMVKLLCVDLAHQVLKVTSPKDAYRPYLDLLNDAEVPAEQREWLRRYIYERWAATTPENANLADLPDIVLVALGELAREEGNVLFAQAVSAQQEGNEGRAQALTEQKMVKLTRAIKVLTALRNRQNVDPSVDAKAMYNLAYARYFTDPGDPVVLMDAAKLWTELAQKAPPNTPEAMEAAGNAEMALRPWYIEPSRPAELRPVYEQAAQVLFEKYGGSGSANDARLFYAYYVLLPAGKHLEAAEMFAAIPLGHRDYYQSRGQWVQALFEAYRAAAEKDKPELANRLSDAARTAVEDLDRGIESAHDAGDRDALLTALGTVRLVQFDLLVRSRKPQEALALVADFEGRFGHDQLLIREVLQRRIVLLAELNKLDDLTAQAKELMLKFPQDAGPVIDGVLRRVEAQVEELRAAIVATQVDADRSRYVAQRSVLAAAGVPLAELLLQWAQNQGFGAGEMAAYKLTYANALRISGDAKKAVEVLDPITKDPDLGQNLEVLHAYGEALFAAALHDGKVNDQATLIKAASCFDQIILGVPNAPFPPQWWNAWMRRLQVSEALDQGTGAITARVRELRVMEAGLGGEPYRSELSRLETKYASQAK